MLPATSITRYMTVNTDETEEVVNLTSWNLSRFCCWHIQIFDVCITCYNSSGALNLCSTTACHKWVVGNVFTLRLKCGGWILCVSNQAITVTISNNVLWGCVCYNSLSMYEYVPKQNKIQLTHLSDRYLWKSGLVPRRDF